MHLFQVSFDRCLFSRMVCPPSIPSVSVYLFTRKKKSIKINRYYLKVVNQLRFYVNVPWSYCLLGMSSLIQPSISGVAVSLSGL